VLILYFRPTPPDPLEHLPDLEGEYKGVTRQKQSHLSYERVRPDRQLPARLRVALGQTIRVGDVEVTPLRVELRRLTIQTAGFAPEKGLEDSLVLHLSFRNVSHDLQFCPTDPFFERRWKEGQAPGRRPYAQLQMGAFIFHGGPIEWSPGRPRETIEGQTHRILRPGEEVTTFICTDDREAVGKFLAAYDGPILWRVQFRRGLVSVRDREVPATAVIGVEFFARDVTRS
jgi:hypothetical protein